MSIHLFECYEGQDVFMYRYNARVKTIILPKIIH
jgi:hypothetical protein